MIPYPPANDALGFLERHSLAISAEYTELHHSEEPGWFSVLPIMAKSSAKSPTMRRICKSSSNSNLD